MSDTSKPDVTQQGTQPLCHEPSEWAMKMALHVQYEEERLCHGTRREFATIIAHALEAAYQKGRDEGLEQAATYAANWILPDGDHCTELAVEIRALKSEPKNNKGE